MSTDSEINFGKLPGVLRRSEFGIEIVIAMDS